MSAPDAAAVPFDNPGRYVICVRGEVPRRWADRLDDLTVRPLASRAEPAITVLEGEFADQAALAGVLASLYEMHVTLLSVQYLGEAAQ